MSGANKLVQSENELEGGSIEELNEDLMDANEEAAEDSDE